MMWLLFAYSMDSSTGIGDGFIMTSTDQTSYLTAASFNDYSTDYETKFVIRVHPNSTPGNYVESMRFTNNEVVVNEASRDCDFRVESDGNGNMLTVDASTNAVGFGKRGFGSGAVQKGAYFSDGSNNHFHLVVTHTDTTAGDSVVYLNRQSSDGDLIAFRQANTTEGKVSVSGTTVSYVGGHLSRWSRLQDNIVDPTILKGTVMTNLDAMVEWAGEDNEQLNQMAVSSVEGDPNVAGVFVHWDVEEEDGYNDMNIAMTGDMIIRIAQGTTVQRGDLL